MNNRFIAVNIFLFFHVALFSYGQEIITMCDGRVSFQIPAGVINRNVRPLISDFPTIQDFLKFWDGRIALHTDIFTEEYLRSPYQSEDISEKLSELFRSKPKLTDNDWRMLFSSGDRFPVFKYAPEDHIWDSYVPIKRGSVVVGESHFLMYMQNLEAPSLYRYLLHTAIGNNVVSIDLTLQDDSYTLLKALPNYFVLRNGTYYWKDSAAADKFYKQLSTDAYKDMPTMLQQFREAWDFILSTLKINGVKIE